MNKIFCCTHTRSLMKTFDIDNINLRYDGRCMSNLNKFNNEPSKPMA